MKPPNQTIPDNPTTLYCAKCGAPCPPPSTPPHHVLGVSHCSKCLADDLNLPQIR